MKQTIYRIIILAAVLILLASYPMTRADASVTVIDLGTLGGDNSTALAINDKLHIVGHSETAQGWEHAFLWKKGQMIDLGTLFEYGSSDAFDINNRGEVVGRSDTEHAETHAFLWNAGVMIDLGTLGGSYSEAAAINDNGLIVGTSTTSDGTSGFLWVNGAMIELVGLVTANDINNFGVIVGGCEVSPGETRACLWENGEIAILGTLGGWSDAYSINDARQVIGFSRTDDDYLHSFFWENGVIEDIGTLGGTTTWANKINNAGKIVGTSTNSLGEQQVYIWENGVMTPVGDLWSVGNAINTNGKIVGNIAMDDGSAHAALWLLK